MNIERIRLINFRNYLSLNLSLNKKINVFIGKNAQGKTNFLEAIYVCATGKSFRTNNDREMINFEKDQAYIGAYMNIDHYERFIEVKLDRNQAKTIRINKNELENHKELNSGLNVVVFAPDDLRLVKDGPAKRRDFLDSEISQIKPMYNFNISRYNKILYQRNNVLRSNKSYNDKKDLLDIFDIQLAKIGSQIILERDRYIKELSSIAEKIHKKVTSSNEEIKLEYDSNIEYNPDIDLLMKDYLNELAKNMDRDIEARSTSPGPHRDDMKVSVNGKDLRTYGSQGQQRTTVLSIKLSEVELIKQERGSYPVLLLDDVFSELDGERRKYLIESLKDIQTIITVTDTMNLEEMKDIDKSIFYVKDGILSKRGFL